MSAPKTNVVYGLMGDVESSYLAMPTLNVSNHGIQLAEQPEISDDYGFDGSPDQNPGSGDTPIRYTPVGRFIKPLSLKIRDKGASAAYSGSVKPRDLSVPLRIAGFVETGSFGAGTEKYTYTLTSPVGAPSSGGFEAYCRGTTAGTGEKWPIYGAYADWMYEVQNGQPGLWTFTVNGVLQAAPSEVSWPAIVYAPSVLVPTASPLVLSINGVTSLVIRSLTLRGQRKIGARFPDANASSGHAGFHPSNRAIELEFLMEASLFATFNPYALRAAATAMAVTFQTGATQYNRTKFSLPQVQVRDASPEVVDEVPCTRVICTAHSSTPILNDSLTVTKD